ncbi:MAG: hypothetical protein ACJ8GJ_25375 [Vitreoscilla sp.]
MNALIRCLLPCAALASTAVAAASHTGSILEMVPLHQGNNWAIVDIPSGKERVLPRTPIAVAGTGRELWSASRASAHTLVRASSDGSIDFFDSETLQFLGGFNLRNLPGTNAPAIVSNDVFLSPDGRYVAAYWIPNYHQRKPEVVVFDRQGNIVQDGSPLEYDAAFYQNALTWLPVGDANLHVAGNRLVLRQIGNDKYVSSPFHLPPGALEGGPTLAASPDGHRLAVSLPVALRTGLGSTNRYWLMFVVGLDGSGMHQLTRPSARVLEHGWDAYHVSPSWSTDGRTVFFVVGHTQAYGAPYYQNPCANVIAIAADGGVQAIDGEDDAPNLTVRSGNGPLRACRHAQWILR